MSDTKKSKAPIGIFSPIIDAFRTKYAFFSLLSVIIVVLTYFLENEDMINIFQVLAAIIIIFIAVAVRNFRLRHSGINMSVIAKNRKALDPRLMGTLDDISGVGSMLGILVGFSAALSDFFIVDGGLFALDNYLAPMAVAAAKSIIIGASVSMISSKYGMMCSLYLAVVNSFGNDNAVKNICKVTHYPEVMKNLRAVCTARITASAALTVSIVIASFSGAGCPVTCIGAAFFCACLMILTDSLPKCKAKVHTDEKIRLWNKRNRSFCILNVLVFVLISVMLLYTFPMRAVFTDYTVKHEFVYDEEEDYSIKPFSVPEHNDDNAPLFTAYYVICMGMLIIIAGAAKSDEAESFDVMISGSELIGYIVCGAAAVGYAVIKGFFRPESAMTSIMWLVSLSFVCLIVAINLFRRFSYIRKLNTKK